MGRSPCCDKVGVKKGPWTPEEDNKLIQYIQMNGPGNWRTLPKNAGLQRCGKSCRLRWTNYLRPDIKRGRFSFEEEETVIQLHSILGNKWSAIAARLPGRTDNEIKNYWNTHIRKRLLRMGIDPVTHSPRLDLLDLSSILSSARLNLSNLLGLQALVNPELLRLASTLLEAHQENPEMLLQKLQENQLLNTQIQNQTPMINPNNFQTALFDQTHLIQEMGTGQVLTDPTGLSCQNFQETFQENASCSGLNGSFVNLPNYGCNMSDQITTDPSDNSAFQSMNNSSKNSQNFNFDSIMSTPMSSPTRLNSSPTFINGSTEDERERYCSDMLKFQIPEGLDFDNLMM